MSDRGGQVIGLVTTMQDEFLRNPGLTLTISEAQERFDVDKPTCEAVLGALEDARVLARTTSGYTRFFPRRMVRGDGTDTSPASREQVAIVAA